MIRNIAIFGLFIMTVTLGACSSTCTDRATASDEKVEAYKPRGSVDTRNGI